MKCEVCGSKRIKEKVKKDNVTYVRCNNCGFVTQVPFFSTKRQIQSIYDIGGN